MKTPIYMDCHATTPVDPRVLDAMLPYLREHFGNASSRTHSFGWVAAEAVEKAREQVAAILGAQPGDVIFTAGASESIHLGIRGAALARRDQGRHLVTTAIEHKAVLETMRGLERDGFEVTIVPVRPDGIVDPDVVARALRDDTILVAVMAANNEVGTLQPLAEIGALAASKRAHFFVDAAQAVGKIPLDVDALRIDLLALSAHKLYGPKGIGALFIRRRGKHVRIEPVSGGGGQEKGLRSGTLNVPGIVGLGAACAVAAAEMPEEAVRLRGLRDRLLHAIRSQLDDVTVNGSLAARLPGNLNLSFAGAQGEALLMELNDVAVSPGAACDSKNSEPSHVVRAMGVPDDLARSSLRFGLGRFNTAAEVDYVAARVVDCVRRLRAMSPLYTPGEGAVEEKTT
jgi:cysteine desulfurase